MAALVTSLRHQPPRASRRHTPFVGFRLYRQVANAICRRRYRVDFFLINRFLPYLVSDRLCYLTVWYQRAARGSFWLVGDLIRVYRGRKWRGLWFRHLGVGQHLGVFARTRTLAVFQQAKTRKKRAKAEAAKAAAAASRVRVDQLRKFRGKSARAPQGLRVLNKAYLGSRWLTHTDVTAAVDSSDSSVGRATG